MPLVWMAGCNHCFSQVLVVPFCGDGVGMLVHCWVSGALVLSWCQHAIYGRPLCGWLWCVLGVV